MIAADFRWTIICFESILVLLFFFCIPTEVQGVHNSCPPVAVNRLKVLSWDSNGRLLFRPPKKKWHRLSNYVRIHIKNTSIFSLDKLLINLKLIMDKIHNLHTPVSLILLLHELPSQTLATCYNAYSLKGPPVSTCKHDSIKRSSDSTHKSERTICTHIPFQGP